jgi:hypothetical protein
MAGTVRIKPVLPTYGLLKQLPLLCNKTKGAFLK